MAADTNVGRVDGLPAETSSAQTHLGEAEAKPSTDNADAVLVSTRPAIELPAIVVLPNFQTGELEEFDTTDAGDMVKVRARAIDEADRWSAWKKTAEEALRQYADRMLQLRFTAGSMKVAVEKIDVTTLSWDDQVLMELEHVLDREQYLELCRPEYVLKPQSVKLQSIVKNFPDSAAAEIIQRAEIRRVKPSRGVQVTKS